MGFSVYDHYSSGYVVRQMTPRGWQMALVVYDPELKGHPESPHLHHDRENPSA